MANTSAIWQQAASTTYQLLAAQEPHKKVYLSMKNAGEGFGERKKSREWTISRKMTRQQQD